MTPDRWREYRVAPEVRQVVICRVGKTGISNLKDEWQENTMVLNLKRWYEKKVDLLEKLGIDKKL